MIEDVTQQIDKFFADGAIAVSSRYWHLRIELNIRGLTNIITFFQRNNQGKTTFFQRNGMMICHKSGAKWPVFLSQIRGKAAENAADLGRSGAKLRILMGIGEGGGRASKLGVDDVADAANEIERQIYQLELFALRCCCTVDGKWLGPNSYCNINIGIIHKHL